MLWAKWTFKAINMWLKYNLLTRPDGPAPAADRRQISHDGSSIAVKG